MQTAVHFTVRGSKTGGVGVVLCLFSKPKASGRSGPQEQSFGWSRPPSLVRTDKCSAQRGRGAFNCALGATALLADLHKSLASSPLVHSIAAAVGLFLHLMGNTRCVLLTPAAVVIVLAHAFSCHCVLSFTCNLYSSRVAVSSPVYSLDLETLHKPTGLKNPVKC